MNARKIGQKRHQHDLDGFEYVMRMPGTSRSGRKVKPKVYNDGTVSLVGCVDESGTVGKPLQSQQGRINTDSPRDTSAEDCQSPMGRDVHRRIMNDSQQGKKHVVKNTGGGIFKAAAVNVLREEGRLMTTGEITKAALQRGFIKCSGKTPDATMASALYTDIKRRTGESVFVRPREGLFGLREWDGTHISSLDGKKSDECQVNSSDESQKKEMKRGTLLGRGIDSHGVHVEGVDTVGQTLGSTNGLTNAVQYASRDGLIDLLSAAEKVNNNNYVPRSPKRRRKILITAVSRPTAHHIVAKRESTSQKTPYIRSPRNKRKPQFDLISNDASVGEKGSVCVKQEDSLDGNREDVCVQSPRTNLHSTSDGVQVVSWSKAIECSKESYSENDIKGQLQFLRYCVQNPNDITRVRAEETLLHIEEALLSHEERMSDDERLNNAWKPQEDIYIGEILNGEKTIS